MNRRSRTGVKKIDDGHPRARIPGAGFVRPPRWIRPSLLRRSDRRRPDSSDGEIPRLRSLIIRFPDLFVGSGHSRTSLCAWFVAPSLRESKNAFRASEEFRLVVFVSSWASQRDNRRNARRTLMTIDQLTRANEVRESGVMPCLE